MEYKIGMDITDTMSEKLYEYFIHLLNKQFDEIVYKNHISKDIPSYIIDEKKERAITVLTETTSEYGFSDCTINGINDRVKDALSRVHFLKISDFIKYEYDTNKFSLETLIKDFISEYKFYETHKSISEFCMDYGFPYAYLEIIDDKYVFYVE